MEVRVFEGQVFWGGGGLVCGICLVIWVRGYGGCEILVMLHVGFFVVDQDRRTCVRVFVWYVCKA